MAKHSLSFKQINAIVKLIKLEYLRCLYFIPYKLFINFLSNKKLFKVIKIKKNVWDRLIRGKVDHTYKNSSSEFINNYIS